jgi:hypothetical protein
MPAPITGNSVGDPPPRQQLQPSRGDEAQEITQCGATEVLGGRSVPRDDVPVTGLAVFCNIAGRSPFLVAAGQQASFTCELLGWRLQAERVMHSAGRSSSICKQSRLQLGDVIGSLIRRRTGIGPERPVLLVVVAAMRRVGILVVPRDRLAAASTPPQLNNWNMKKKKIIGIPVPRSTQGV